MWILQQNPPLISNSLNGRQQLGLDAAYAEHSGLLSLLSLGYARQIKKEQIAAPCGFLLDLGREAAAGTEA